MTKSVTKIQDKDTTRRLSVVRSTEDPTKYWIVILNPDGSKIRWPKGEKGDAATVSVGGTCTWEAWTCACVINSWDCHNAVLDFVIPRGEKGETWTAATVSVGSTSTLPAWCCATVNNSGSSSDAVLNFGIPKWDKGDKWDTGNAATVSVGTTSTGQPWSNASVINSGTSSNAIFNFTVPRGDKGEKWDTGNGATVSVGSTTTLDAWCSACVSNSWSSSEAIFNFWIPKGEKGDKGDIWCTWATWNGIASVSCSKSWKVTTVTIEETNGCSASFSVCDGADGEGSGDVLWPSSSTDWHIVLFDGNSGKCIRQWGAVVNVLNSSSTTDVLSAKQWCVLNSCISSINSKIPSSATSSNQLADKDFVNSSLNSLAAFYITKNAQGEQFNSYAELSSATVFYSGWVVRVPTQNDYTIVKDDETHDDNTTRYLYQWSQWEYQYTVNETPLTQAQLNALNSWITSAKVSTYDGYANNKQDKLESGTNIKTVNGCSLMWSWDITTPDTQYNQATCSVLWLIKLWSSTVQSVGANAVSGCNNRTYALQVNSSGQGVVNVPWENTTYSANCFDINNLADACGCRSSWNWKQEALVSGTNIKTVNNISLLGSGNVTVQGVISDLATIRNGACCWSTALQPNSPISCLCNDVWFITSSEIPTDNCQLNNGCGYTTCIWTLTQSAISDTAFWSSWNGDSTHAPSKNAIYDVLGDVETLLANL